MVTLLLDATELDIVLSRTERTLSRRKDDVTVSRAQIVKAQRIADAWNWIRGVPDPGAAIPGVVAMGTWRSAAGADFVIVRRRRPAVVIDLDGHPEFQRLVLTTRHGVQLLRALRLDAGDGDDVTEMAD